MNIRNYAPIGKAILHRAIGLQENYTMQSCSKRCKTCPVAKILKNYKLFPETKEYKKAINLCSHCPYQNETETVYVNETNKFGFSPKLKSNAMLLFVFYHLLGPNEYGIIANIPIKFLADNLNVSEKTIRENNKMLANKGYIYLSHSINSATVNICLTEYRNYFKPATEGGRGYLTITKELFHGLVLNKTINLLRIQLKSLLEIDDFSLTNQGNSLTKTYKELQRFLPSYCKRNVIQKLLSLKTPAFSFQYNDMTITTILADSYNGKNAKKQAFTENETKIRNTIKEINQLVQEQERNPFHKYTCSEHHFNRLFIQKYAPIHLTEGDIKDMASLSIQYSLDFVFRAFSVIYKDYIIENISIQNLGGLIRTQIRSFLDSSLQTA